MKRMDIMMMKKFDNDREALFQEFREKNIRFVMNIGANMPTSMASVELAEKYDFIYAAVGTHPNDVGEMTEQDIETYREMASYEK